MVVAVLNKPAFKPMRKGTRSCQECRRRKIKCIYDNDDAEICKECLQHNRYCIKQGYKPSKTITAHVAKAEQVINRLGSDTSHSDDTSSTTGFRSGSGSISRHDLKNGLSDVNTQSPFLDVFKTGILSQHNTKATKPPVVKIIAEFQDDSLDDNERLLSSISGDPHILDVLDTTCAWWIAWRDQHPALGRESSNLRNFVVVKLGSHNPVQMATGLICLALALLFLRSGLDDSTVQLSTNPKDIMVSILAAIDEVILNQSQYSNDPGYVLLMLLRSKHFAENNQVRQAWLYMQKGISVAQNQSCGIPRPGVSTEALQTEQQFLGDLLEMDSFMSMIFGFPYVLDNGFADKLALQVLKERVDNTTLKRRALRRVTAVVARRMSDANREQWNTDPVTITQISGTLRFIHAAMSSDWWEPYQYATSEDIINSFETLMTQLWYWQSKSFFYLPFLLKSTDHPTSEILQNRTLCLEASRNLIQIFNILRSNPSLSIHVCNCDDFQAVLSGCILLVGNMQNINNTTDETTNSNINTTQFEYDMNLIEDLKDIFHYRAFEQGGMIAKQGLNVLNTLMSFFEDGSKDEKEDDKPVAVMLPYFGTIYVRSNKEAMAVKRSGLQLSSGSPPSPTVPADKTSNGDLLHAIPRGKNTTNLSLSNSMEQNMTYQPSTSQIDQLESYHSSDMVNWEDWSEFMFDDELAKDWNPSHMGYDFIMDN